ncbi:MAG: tetratricopeptide repeat protein, partial [Myxococcota bacterium]|nr:tetratricopeptide repeat protein [Myxococcota bacterium]
MNIQNQLQKLLQLGFTHHQAGRLQEAEQLYRRIIAIEQEHELSNNFLGAIAKSFGHHEAAVKHFRIAIQRNASNAAAHNGLGRSLHRLSKLEDAKGALVVACQLSPKSPNFYNNLGNLLIDLDNLELATEVYEKAIALDPNLVEAHTNAARAYSMAGNTDKAFQVYQHVLNINPSFYVAHLNIGQLYEEQSEHEKAREHYEQAIAQRPTFLPALFNLAHLHQNTGQHDLAQVNYHKVLQLNPNHVDTLMNLAQFDPKSKKAKEYLERAYECAPKNPIVIRGLGLFHLMRKEYSLAKDWFLKGIPLAPNDIVFYQALAIADLEMKFYDKALLSAQYALSLQPNQTETLFLLSLIHKGQNNREEAHAFAKQAYELAPARYYLSQLLGVLHSEEGNFDEARRFLNEALSLSPRQMNVQRHIALIQTQVEEDALETMMKRFRDDTEGSGEQRIHLGFATAKLLDDAGRHAESFEILRQSNELVREGLIFHIELFREAYQNIIDMSLQTSISPLSVSEDDPVPIFIVGMPRSGTTLTEQILASHSQVHPLGEISSLMDSIPDYPNILSALDEKTLRSIRNAYFSLLPKDMASPFFTDKMPFNFKYIPMIALAFPRARIINLVRDPMDTCFSIYKKFFSNRHRYAYRLDEIGAMYLIYQNMMEAWRERYLFRDQSYESLVQDQEAQTRALLEFCGLSYEAAALDFHQTKRHVNTASFYQIRQPIYQTSIGAWRPYAK